MAEPKPNPLLGAVFGMAQDRQAADVARLEMLARVVNRLEALYDGQCRTNELLTELVERTRK